MNRTLLYASLLIVGLGLGIMFWIFPYAFDDYSYMRFLQITENGLPEQIDWDIFKNCLNYRIQSDNLRLANMAAVFALALPKPIIGLLSGALFALALFFLAKTIGVNSRNGKYMTLLAFLSIFLLPWWEYAAAVDYQFNYVWASAWLAVCIWLFLGRQKLGWFAGIIFGSILGLWHEGFAIPAFLGLAAIWIFWKEYRTVGRSFMLAFMALGIAFLIWVPGTRFRASIHNELLSSYYIYRTVIAVIPIVAFIILSIWLWIKGKKNAILNPVWIAFMIICLSSSIFKFVTDDFRGVWAGILIACAGIVYLVKSISINIKPILACSLLLLTSVTLAYGDAEAFRERNILNQAVAHIRKNNDQPFFVKNLRGFYNAPIGALGKPLYTMWRWPGFGVYYGLEETVPYKLSVVPEELRFFSPDSAEKLPCGWWKTREGWIVKPHDRNDFSVDDMDMIVVTPFAEEIVWVTFNPFRSEADSTLYEHVFPTLAPPWTRPIRDIRPYSPNINH